QRLGFVVRCLPRRAPGAGAVLAPSAGDADRPELQGRARGGHAVAAAIRQPLHRFALRSAGPHRPRLRCLRRAGDLRDRPPGCRALQAQRPDHARGAARQDRAAAEEARSVKQLAWFLAALCVTAAAIAQTARPAAEDPALEARMMTIANELRCLVCQNQTIAD